MPSRLSRPTTTLNDLPEGPPLARIAPMLLTELKGRDLSGPEWLWELKMDGYRALAEWDAGEVKVKSRNGVDATGWFPEVTRSLATLGAGRCIVDGEMCVLDEFGRSDFDRLHARARLRGYKPGCDPVVFCVFDVLVLQGQNVMGLPLLERKALLESLLESPPPSTLYARHSVGGGDTLYEQAVALKLEGVVAKRATSVYVPGSRSVDWVKKKRPGAVPPQRFGGRGSR